MANPGDGFELPIKVTGANEAAAELRKVEQAKEAAAKPVSSGNPFQGSGGKGISALASPAPDLAIEEKITTEEAEQLAIKQRQLAIESTKQAIIDQEEEALAARVAGEVQFAAQLERELLIMREQLSILRNVNVTEEQAVRLAVIRVQADEADAVAKRAQATATRLSAEAAREEASFARQTHRDYLEAARVREAAERRASQAARETTNRAGSSSGEGAGAFGRVAGGFGLGGLAGAVGTAIAAEQQLEHVVREVFEYHEKMRAASAGMGDDLQRQVEQWGEIAARVRDISDLPGLKAQLFQGLAGLQQNLAKGVAAQGDGIIDGIKQRLGPDFLRGIGLDPETSVDKAAKAAGNDAARAEKEVKRLIAVEQEWLAWRGKVEEGTGEDKVASYAAAIAGLEENQRRLSESPILNAGALAEGAALIQTVTHWMQQAGAEVKKEAAEQAREAERKERTAETEVRQLNDILTQREQLTNTLKSEIPIMEARAAGNEREAKILEARFETEQKIAALGNKGVLTPEIEKQLRKLEALKEQQIIQDDESKKAEKAAREAEREADARERAAQAAERAKNAIEETINSIDPDVETGGTVRSRKTKLNRSREKTMAKLEEEIANAKAKNQIDDAGAQEYRDRAAKEFDRKVSEEKGRFGATTAADARKNKGAITAPDVFSHPEEAMKDVRSPRFGASHETHGAESISGAASGIQQAAQDTQQFTAGAQQLVDALGVIPGIGAQLIAMAEEIKTLKGQVQQVAKKLGN